MVSKVFGNRVIVKCGTFVQNVSVIKFNINLRSPVSGLTETPEWIQVIMMMVMVAVTLMVMDGNGDRLMVTVMLMVMVKIF